MVIIEEQHEQEPKRHSHKDPFRSKVPKVNNPVSGLCRVESLGDGHRDKPASLR
jgi:hypothetical protein